MSGGTYAEYLETVRRQEQRDRDRFMGHDSHDDEPRYAAANGSALDMVDISLSVDALVSGFETLNQAMTKCAQETAEFLNVVMFGDPSAAQPLGILQMTTRESRSLRTLPKAQRKERASKKPRHTYPKPHAEWWNR